MRTWKRNLNEIQQLVEAFYTNDLYYPRPNPDDPLYKEFSTGYLSAHPKESRDAIDVGEAFLHVIENEQCRRISVN
jgi:Zinc finger protein